MTCRECGEEKTDDSFWKDHRSGRPRRICKPCQTTNNREYRRAQPPEVRRVWERRGNLRRNFGMTLKDYAEMLTAQNGLCAICGSPETAQQYGRIRALAVDHRHDSGVVRALLCGNCNNLLGRAKDDPTLLRKAAEYIEAHP